MPQAELGWSGDHRYNKVRQKSVHNAFQRREGIADQFLYWRARSLEVDVHHHDVFGRSWEGDWSVHHDWYDPTSTVARLSQVFEIMRGLNRLVPNHEVTTLFIDIKDPFPDSASARYGWKAFDTLLDNHFGSLLYRPRDLLRRGQASSLRGAIGAHGWPSLDELRGRFIVVLTGGPQSLANYAPSRRDAGRRSAFVSVAVDERADAPGHGDEVFFNVNGEKNLHLVRPMRALGFVTRAFYLNRSALWQRAIADGVQHLSTDKVNERLDPWATTVSREGQPLQPIDHTAQVPAEPGSVVAVWSRSGDLWDESDSFHFAYRAFPATAVDNTWDYAISGPNSHTDDYVKGAVLARASLDCDAAYFGVVRVGENGGLRVQWRAEPGGETMAVERHVGPGSALGRDIDPDTVVHVRLKIDRGGHRGRAWGSHDRQNWVLFGEREFDTPLRYQGLGVSSHDQDRGAKFLFVGPEAGASRPFDRSIQIGARTGDAGWVDWDGDGRWLTSGFSRFKPR